MAKWDARLVEVLPTGTQPMRGFIDRLMRMELHSQGSALTELSPEQARAVFPTVARFTHTIAYLCAEPIDWL